MRLWSEAWANGEPIPDRFAAARLDEAGELVASDNLSPPLRWSGLPAGTRSLALLCHDFDSPITACLPTAPVATTAVVASTASASELALAALRADPRWSCEYPAAHERRDFFHWVLVDLPAHLAGLGEGQWRGDAGAADRPLVPVGAGARQGRHDFAVLFADRPGRCDGGVGYCGPLPPPGDALAHHIVFALFALSIERLALPERFTGRDVREAIAGCVLGSATHSGTFTLNRRLRAVAA